MGQRPAHQGIDRDGDDARRARWRIENETFNTLKNQGDRFEHNFGHGHQHLATGFAYLMMLAFPRWDSGAGLIDQVQQRGCTLFAKARARAERPRSLWDKSLPRVPSGVRRLFLTFPVTGWETLYQAIAFGYRGEMVLYDTS